MQRVKRVMSAALVAWAGSAAGQAPDGNARPAVEMVEAPSVMVDFADADAERVAEALTGTWRSVGPVEGDTETTIVMSVAPVMLEGIGSVLYAEIAREGEMLTPYRQVLLHLYRFEDQLRLRTLEFKDPAFKPTLVGMAHAPDRFPETVTLDGLYATLDMQVDVSGAGFSGRTPHPYPTTESGAVQMTSSMRLTGDELVTGDTGYGPDGSVVWGGESSEVRFERARSLVTVDRWEDGLIAIRFDQGEGEPAADGDRLAIHYTGRLTDGTKFDSSRDRGQPFEYVTPGRLIEGWLRATEDVRQGAAMRVIIPPELGYGSRANARIPANSTLLFDIEAIHINRAEETEAQPQGDAADES